MNWPVFGEVIKVELVVAGTLAANFGAFFEPPVIFFSYSNATALPRTCSTQSTQDQAAGDCTAHCAAHAPIVEGLLRLFKAELLLSLLLLELNQFSNQRGGLREVRRLAAASARAVSLRCFE